MAVARAFGRRPNSGNDMGLLIRDLPEPEATPWTRLPLHWGLSMRISLGPETGRATLAPPTCISGRLRCLLLSCGAIWALWLHLGRVKNMV